MKLSAFASLMLLAATAAVAGEPQQLEFRDWIVGRADDGSSFSALTMASEDAGFGEWCFVSSKTCTWELLINTACQDGEKHLLLANSTRSYSALQVTCLGKSTGNMYVYVFNWKDLEDLIKSPTNVSKVAFALPIGDSQFRVVRFSLNGLKESTGMLEQHFFKGAQPASIGDETL